MNKQTLEQEFNREFVEARDNWKALCPFHDEKTPSFFVHKEEHLGNCFGCGVHGYVDILLSRYAQISVQEARKRLGINVIERASKERSLESTIPEVFPESWLAAWPKKAHKSILARGISVEVLKSVGACFDPTTRRQVFPHRNEAGDLIGAAGRATDSREPKWYFYWSYPRGRSLYQPDGKTSDRLLVVEGIFDVLKVKEAKIESLDTAATLGTQFGKGQLKQIKEYDEVLIGFDADKSGQEAGLKLYEQIKKSCKVLFVSWPEGIKDAGDCSEEQIKDSVKDTISYVQKKTLQTSNSGSGIFV